MSSAEALSALIGSALPPAASISLTSRFAFSFELKYVNATAAPSEASRLTIPSPIPREPPVTRATLPANDRPYFSVMSILQSGPNLPYWIIRSRIRFRFLSVRRIQSPRPCPPLLPSKPPFRPERQRERRALSRQPTS